MSTVFPKSQTGLNGTQRMFYWVPSHVFKPDVWPEYLIAKLFGHPDVVVLDQMP